MAAGFYDWAALLFRDAADRALTPSGASVLREKAAEAEQELRQQQLAEAGVSRP